MAGETYYFFFSMIAVIGMALYLINLLRLRARGKTTFGFGFKAGTPEYERVIKLASNRNIAITIVVTVIFIANFIYDVNRLLNFKDREYAHGLLLYAPIATILFSVLIFFIVRKQVKGYMHD